MNRGHLNNKRYANSIAPQSFKPPRANFLCHKIRKYTRVHSRTRVFDHSTNLINLLFESLKTFRGNKSIFFSRIYISFSLNTIDIPDIIVKQLSIFFFHSYFNPLTVSRISKHFFCLQILHFIFRILIKFY